MPVLDGKAFVYGLPELKKEEIKKAKYIAKSLVVLPTAIPSFGD